MSQQSRIGKTATKIGFEDGKHYVQYHDTKVVIWDHENITLNTGGWMTATTKSRMNQTARQMVLNFSVYQKDYRWFVSKPDGDTVDFATSTITFKRRP